VERSLVRLQDLAGKPILGFRAREAEQHQLADKNGFIHADFLEFDLKDTFDISIAMGVFDYVPDQVAFLRKMVALTTDKGYRDTPQITTVSTTPSEERVEDGPNAFCKRL
jgi:cyclopropane fatty-acyl-phospholipid synthase-like methyltransferase